jgi:chromate transporter
MPEMMNAAPDPGQPVRSDSLESRGKRLFQVLGLFLKLGAISFGGPAAHTAFMETEVVRRRQWLTREHFLDLVSVTNLVPGPNATEMAVYIGYVRAGWPGLVLGGVTFILPAALISGALAVMYVRFGGVPAVQALFWGINPAVIAIIVAATYRLGRTAFRDWKLALLGAACLAAALLGVDQAITLIVAGLVGIAMYGGWRPTMGAAIGALLPLMVRIPALVRVQESRLTQLGLYFLKVGALLFGSGMVLFAFIQRDVVGRFGWLTPNQLVDAIAVGQLTPGPVLSSATFIGYLVSGWQGAVVVTAAIFFPSFVIMALVSRFLPRVRAWRPAQAFLKGVNAAAVALILAVAIGLGRTALVDVWTVLIMLVSLGLLLRFRAQTWWLVVGGAALGAVRMLAMR